MTIRQSRWLSWPLAIAATILLAARLMVVRPAWTPSIEGAHAVATLRQETLNGRKQWVLTRGQDRDLPVVLFLHGGPGMPAMYLAHVATRPLERDFVVVHWDRRDAGKSFDPKMPPDGEKVSPNRSIAHSKKLCALQITNRRSSLSCRLTGAQVTPMASRAGCLLPRR